MTPLTSQRFPAEQTARTFVLMSSPPKTQMPSRPVLITHSPSGSRVNVPEHVPGFGPAAAGVAIAPESITMATKDNNVLIMTDSIDGER
jgi:hypothetical protein